MKVRRWLVAAVFFAVLWLFVGGASLTPRSLLANFIVGLAVGVPIAFVFRRLYGDYIDIAELLRGIPYFFLYVGVFSKELLVANLDVTYRVLAPGPLKPQVILVPLRVETDLGVTTIANSISLTPGTVTLDYNPEEHALYVHGIDGRHPEAMAEPIREWEDLALCIFDEDKSPSDPAPEITIHPPDYPPEPKIGELDPVEGFPEIDQRSDGDTESIDDGQTTDAHDQNTADEQMDGEQDGNEQMDGDSTGQHTEPTGEQTEGDDGR